MQKTDYPAMEAKQGVLKPPRDQQGVITTSS